MYSRTVKLDSINMFLENAPRSLYDKSPVTHLRNLNNFLKSCLISGRTKQLYSVLDLCCGKGGDLLKWANARIRHYVGIDIAHNSVRGAVARYNGILSELSIL